MKVVAGGALAGAALAIRVPAKGSYYLSTEPSEKYNFQPAGRLERDHLTVTLREDTIEIATNGNLLKNSVYSTIWVYREAGQSKQYLARERNIRTLETALAGLRSIYSEDHPEVRATQSALALLQQKQDELKRTVTLEAAGSVDTLIANPR